MNAIITLVKGFTGKPSHAPLTDVSIGAYTVGVLMLIVGFCGFEEEAMAKGSLLAISGGLIVAIPTSLTGLLDWADLSKGSRARTLANYHLSVMLLATAAFAATWVLQRPGYLDSEVTTNGLVAGCVALGLLTLGGTLGGALAYVYGVRVVKQDVSLADALIPGRLDAPSHARTDFSAAAPPAKTRKADKPARKAKQPAPAAAATVVRPPADAAVPAAAAGNRDAAAEYEAMISAKHGMS
jgi:uncharacterized membrane protein